jgi:hypothetical protein
MSPLMIYGESLHELLGFVAHIDRVVRPNGVDDSVDMPWDLAAPFMRALMRSEAALLLDDANGHREFTRTTTERRQAACLHVETSLAAVCRYLDIDLPESLK